MGASVWSNVQVAVQSALAAADTITGITKANPALVTSTAHGMANGDWVSLDILGMHQLDKSVCRIANVAANTFELEGVDSTSFDTFTSGTAKAITFGTSITSMADINVSGGDFESIDTTTIHDSQKQEIPGAASPTVISGNCNWDPSDAGQIALKAASDAKSERAVRFTWADGKKWVFRGYIGFTHSPTGQAQGKVTTPLSVRSNGRPRAYAS